MPSGDVSSWEVHRCACLCLLMWALVLSRHTLQVSVVVVALMLCVYRDLSHYRVLYMVMLYVVIPTDPSPTPHSTGLL
jgi:hypothetical protein